MSEFYEKVSFTLRLIIMRESYQFDILLYYDLVPYNFDCHCFNHNYDLL